MIELLDWIDDLLNFLREIAMLILFGEERNVGDVYWVRPER